MPRAKRKKLLMHCFHYDPLHLERCFTLPCSPAKKTVILTRSEIDVLRSKPGTTIGCTNSNCAVRLGEAVFGHPVYLAEFMKTSVYIVDRIDRRGQPLHCVWYKHNDPETIELNDIVVDRQELLKRIKLDRDITLSPPRLRHGQKGGGTHAQAPRNAETPRRKAISVGAYRRALKAGFMFTSLQK